MAMATLWMRPALRNSDPNPQNEPVAPRQAGCPPATTPKDDELLLEHEILGHHRSHATVTTQLRGHDGEVEQDEQEVLHARVSVGQRPSATQRCPIREIRARIGDSRPTAWSGPFGPGFLGHDLDENSRRYLRRTNG
jgi:hypothetical protein